MKGKIWTDHENTALVALYFVMVFKARSGLPYNKAAMIREASIVTHDDGTLICGPLRDRSRGSIEAKLMNVTAIVESLGWHSFSMSDHGYRPLHNYQKGLAVFVTQGIQDARNKWYAHCEAAAEAAKAKAG